MDAIDFLPPEYRVERQRVKRLSRWLTIGIVFTVGTFAVGAVTRIHVSKLSEHVNSLNENVEEMEVWLKGAATVSKRLDQVLDQHQELASLRLDGALYLALTLVSNATDDRLRLRHFRFSQHHDAQQGVLVPTLSFSGVADTEHHLITFLGSLEQEAIFRDVALQQSSVSTFENGAHFIEFQVRLVIERPERSNA